MRLTNLDQVFAAYSALESQTAMYCECIVDPSDSHIIMVVDTNIYSLDTDEVKSETVAEYNTTTNQWRFPENGVLVWSESIEEAKLRRDVQFHRDQVKLLDAKIASIKSK
jgi:hypothetical protein